MLSKRQEAFNPNRQRACLCVRLNVMAALFRLINLNRLDLNRSSYIGQQTDCLRIRQRQQVRKDLQERRVVKATAVLSPSSLRELTARTILQ